MRTPEYTLVDETGRDLGDFEGHTAQEAIEGYLFTLGYKDTHDYESRCGRACSLTATPVDPRLLRRERDYIAPSLTADLAAFEFDSIGPLFGDTYLTVCRPGQGEPIFMEAVGYDGGVCNGARASITVASLPAASSAGEIIERARALLDQAVQLRGQVRTTTQS